MCRSLSASSFTEALYPFQWEPQDPIPLLHGSAIWCSRSRRGKSPAIPRCGHQRLEAVFAHDDRRLCAVLEEAHRMGAS
ncbi:MAG: hypothetical protein ACLS8R_09175 [Anaeromassilibacillus sp.]